MKRFLILATVLMMFACVAHAGCPQIDPKHIDMDGMPFCPEEVATGPNSAWAVYACAIEQAKSFHAPVPAERNTMADLLANYHKSTVEGIAADTTKNMMADASTLNLQVCRVLQLRDQVRDSFLVFYAKPNVKDYSGPFMMLRETNHSKVIVIGPHDDSDGTFADTKLALAETNAIATISNGHKRGNVKPGGGDQGSGDFVHDPLSQNLGTFVVDRLCSLFQGSVVLHVHGMANDKKVLVRSRNDQLQKAFEKAVVDHTNIKDFGSLNADFTIDPLVHTDFYLKTEMPAKIHENNKHALAKMVKDIEGYPWAH